MHGLAVCIWGHLSVPHHSCIPSQVGKILRHWTILVYISMSLLRFIVSFELACFLKEFSANCSHPPGCVPFPFQHWIEHPRLHCVNTLLHRTCAYLFTKKKKVHTSHHGWSHVDPLLITPPPNSPTRSPDLEVPAKSSDFGSLPHQQFGSPKGFKWGCHKVSSLLV